MGSKPTKHTEKGGVYPSGRKTKDNSNRGSSDVPSGHSSPTVANQRLSPEWRGFNNPNPARSGSSVDRAERRQTRMLGAEDVGGTHEDLAERPFRQEKVSRVPTKALLKPPKNAGSKIADPDEDQDFY
ncbi:hypothetical protein JKF63_04176 [Porcisia hertigi]|uniref:Uncharacterized protein n=1 Tax=Porcisia hertigi TaxID=2761500 RepID=A0A836L7K9_9TRYP|nr:hypothetical protein JKF63_04176 [Porcisia hertigi]